MIALFLVFLVCSSFSFALGAAWGATVTRYRLRGARYDIAPAVARYQRRS